MVYKFCKQNTSKYLNYSKTVMVTKCSIKPRATQGYYKLAMACNTVRNAHVEIDNTAVRM
jgi:hypothetical protein